MLNDCDYVLDKKGVFWIVKYVYGKYLFANQTFIPDKEGTRYNLILKKRYSKTTNPFQMFRIHNSSIVKVFRPREFFAKNYGRLFGRWKRIADSLIKIGIPKRDIGIFGSYLIGFHVIKDVDFVVYGKNNCRLAKKDIALIRRMVGAGRLSSDHIRYQCKKYLSFLSKKNDFENMLKNKWSSLQFPKDIASTIRFAYLDEERPDDILPGQGRPQIISGEVIEDFGANFVPRTFLVESGKRKIRVLTYFWAYQSCVRKGQKVRIFGNYNKKNKTVYLSDRNHWMKIL